MVQKKLIVVRGIPSSGKSTLVDKILRESYKDEYIYNVSIHSTDYFWMRPDGTYDFNPKLLGQAHDWNFQECCLAIEHGFPVVIVDNTNTMYKEFSRYVEYAINNGYDVEIKEPETTWKFDVEECFKRNTHNVPKEAIQRMLDRWESTESCLEKIEKIK